MRGVRAIAFLILIASPLAAQPVDVEILFRVDMSVQIELGRFDPNADFVVVRGTLNAWGCSETMLESTEDEGVWEITIPVSGHAVGAGEFKYNINCGKGAVGRWEDNIANRRYQVTGQEPDADGDGFLDLALEPVLFDNAQGGGDAEIRFRVAMNVQERLGRFDPALQSVVVRGSLNSWDCSDPMSDPDGDGIWEITIPVRGHPIGSAQYKFNIACDQGGYEASIANRNYSFSGNEPDSDGDGYREVDAGTHYFDNVRPGPDVEFLFRVRVEGAIEAGRFIPDLDELFVRGSFNGFECAGPLSEFDDFIWEIAVHAGEHPLGRGAYKYNIDCTEEGWEFVNDRRYTVRGTEPDADGDGYLEIALPEVIDFDDLNPNVDLPDVEFLFRVDMTGAIIEETFDPDLDTVVVRGDLNGWGCSEPMARAAGNIWAIDIPFVDHPIAAGAFKFNVSCSDVGWEDRIPNREYVVTGAELDSDGDGLVEVDFGTVFFDDLTPFEDCCNGIDDDGDALIDLDDADCTASPPCEDADTFVRGDADASGGINLTDGIAILNWSFQGAAEPACLDAADTDDSGQINLTDPIRIFQWLFLGGAAPEPPSPSMPSYAEHECAADPSDDTLDCATPAQVCRGPG